jgi:hypothetical protein
LQRGQGKNGIAAVDRLAIGESATVERGWHPRHGASTAIVTRVA